MSFATLKQQEQRGKKIRLENCQITRRKWTSFRVKLHLKNNHRINLPDYDTDQSTHSGDGWLDKSAYYEKLLLRPNQYKNQQTGVRRLVNKSNNMGCSERLPAFVRLTHHKSRRKTKRQKKKEKKKKKAKSQKRWHLALIKPVSTSSSECCKQLATIWTTLRTLRC